MTHQAFSAHENTKQFNFDIDHVIWFLSQYIQSFQDILNLNRTQETQCLYFFFL